MKYTLTILIILSAFLSNAQVTTPFVEQVNGAAEGDSISNFSASDQDGNPYSLQNDLDSGEVVVIFIRGKWCGYCNRHLSHLQDSLSQITAKGARLVIVSPEKQEFIAETIKKTKLDATILYDSGYVIMKQFDVLWAPKEKDLAKYEKYFGDKMKQSHSDDTQRLPVPATYIINQNGIIKWRHFDRNYSNRSTVKEIVNNI